MKYVKRLLVAVQFLTIIPFPFASYKTDERDIGGSAGFFPLVGFLQGLLLTLFYVLFMRLFPLEITAVLLIAVLSMSNGGFHLDGLSDTFDALASRKDRQGMLEIMKDSTTGPIGVASVVLLILLKYLVLKNILNDPEISFFIPLLLFPIVGRWAMVSAMYHGKSARNDGLGKIFIDNTGTSEFLVSLLSVLVITAVVLIMGKGVTFFRIENVGVLFPFFGVYTLSVSAVIFFRRIFGGLTGDTLGAIGELSEVLFLLLFLAVYTI